MKDRMEEQYLVQCKECDLEKVFDKDNSRRYPDKSAKSCKAGHMSHTGHEVDVSRVDHIDKLMHSDESYLALKIREAIGAGDNEHVFVQTPQFERIDERENDYVPLTETAVEALRELNEKQLYAMGMRRWEEDSPLWLFPSEWYPHLPEGIEIVDINAEVDTFKRGDSDDDKRFGVLPYGIEVGGEWQLKLQIQAAKEEGLDTIPIKEGKA